MRTTRYAFLAAMLALAPVTQAAASGSDEATFSFRQRTGDTTRYSMHTLDTTHWVDQIHRVRPDIRYKKSYDVDAHGEARKDQQLTEVETHDHPAA
jgi:hypothetical protein